MLVKMRNLSVCYAASSWLLCLLVSYTANTISDAFYIPGVHPHSFGEGDKVKLKVNKMTSVQTQLPIDYYHLPFCKPADGPVSDNENFGELLSGDRIQSSPYKLMMRKDMYCEHVCKTQLGRPEQKNVLSNKVVNAIHHEYHNNWIVDNLSSASKVENDEVETIKYYQGFPIGFVHEKTKLAYIHNHVNIEVMYHRDELEAEKYRIVRLIVEPLSIKHKVDPTITEEPKEKNGSYLPAVGKIENPIPSCDRSKKNPKLHTSYDMVVSDDQEPQPASGEVLFTYDVIWTENEKLHWASRWDIYLDGAGPPSVHWSNILTSLVVVAVLAAMVATILVRNLRRDFARYNRVATSDEEKAEELEEFGWKLVHGDVFRPPSFSPMALAVMCGTGAQLICMTMCTIAISAVGILNPSQRGWLIMVALLLYVFFGGIAGYVTARLYKSFKGKNWQRATLYASFGFPGIAFSFFFVFNLMAWAMDSTDKVPITAMLILIVLWFGISTPLVFFGAYFGYQVDAIDFPVNISKNHAEIPEQAWYMSPFFAMIITGILPFGSFFVELYCLLDSVWEELSYYAFGFLIIVFSVLFITSAEITILFCYFQLCSGDYRWWWSSFCNAGSSAVYVLLYSVSFFTRLEASAPVTYILYFGYMSLASLGLFMMLGSIGVISSLYFNKVIYSSIKVD